MALAALIAGWSGSAAAHGERSEPPFLRMATIQWYDTHWSTERLSVNQELTVSGRFRVVKNWSFAIVAPDLAFLNVDVPGPVMVREASYLDGVPAAASTPLELGRDYEYKLVLRARVPGRYHVHPMIDVRDVGAILGPGKWVNVDGDEAAFTDPVKTLLGGTVDLATYGLGAVVGWHLVWVAVALAWLMYWLRKPLLMPRYEAVQHGKGETLITPADRIAGVALLAATIVIVLAGYLVTRALYPTTIPLQSAWMRIPALPAQPETISIKAERVAYYIPGRTVEFWLSVANHGTKPVRFGEFTTGNIRFLNSSVEKTEPDYPQDLVAPAGLIVEPDDAIQAGESRSVHIKATSEVWETDRLAFLIHDPTSRVGGLFMFFDPDGKRSIVEFDSEIIPTFVQSVAQ